MLAWFNPIYIVHCMRWPHWCTIFQQRPYIGTVINALVKTVNKWSEYQGCIHRHQTPSQYRNAASHASPYGLLWPNMTSSIKPEFTTYRNAARGGPSHGHRGSAHKISSRSVWPFQRYACRQTDTHTDRHTDRRRDTLQNSQTDKLIAILRFTTGAGRHQYIKYISMTGSALSYSWQLQVTYSVVDQPRLALAPRWRHRGCWADRGRRPSPHKSVQVSSHSHSPDCVQSLTRSAPIGRNLSHDISSTVTTNEKN